MGKNHKHKKLLKSEKAKVKLRLKGQKTKFLPKGANVTDTTFKIKPIIVPEQLKIKTDNEPLSKRKLNVKDLLLRLKHHSVSARKDACAELRQIIAAYPEEIIQKYIWQLLHDVCPLVLDRESIVRKEAIKLLDCILENASLDKLNPFFTVLSSYVRCATTDINAAVQEDSLTLVDALLKHAPTLVSKEADRLLPNFFKLLGKFRTQAKADKTGQKATNMSWRLRILQRVNEILNVVAVNEKSVAELMEIDVTRNAKTTNYCPIYSKGIFTATCPLDFFNNTTILESSSETVEKTDYLELLVPLLHETWLEVIPELRLMETKQENTILSQDAAEILDSILKVTQSMFKYYKTKRNGISLLRQSKDLQKFMTQLLKQFPYSQEESMQKSKTKCLTQNLMICYLFCTLNNSLVNRYYCECAVKIITYLARCLLNRNYIPETNLNVLLDVLRIILFENFNSWKKKNVSLDKMLDSVIHFYNNSAIKNKDSLFNFLCDVIDNPLLNRSSQYQIFISSLPFLLCKEQISEKVTNTLLLIAKQGNELFYTSFLKKLSTILENLESLKVVNTYSNTRNARLKVCALFFYIPFLHKENIEEFREFLTKCQNQEVQNDLRNILKLRCESRESDANIKIFRSFL